MYVKVDKNQQLRDNQSIGIEGSRCEREFVKSNLSETMEVLHAKLIHEMVFVMHDKSHRIVTCLAAFRLCMHIFIDTLAVGDGKRGDVRVVPAAQLSQFI